MANKVEVSYEGLINTMKEKMETVTKTIKVLGENIEVKPVLTLEEYDTTLSRMVSLIFGSDDSYNAAAVDFVIRLCTVFAYTGVTMPDDIGENIDSLYDLMYGTDFYELVKKNINQDQYQSLLNAFREEVDYRNKSKIERVERRIDELSQIIENLGAQFADMMGDLSQEDVERLVAAIENNQLDERKLLKAYAEEKAHTNKEE